MSNNSHIFFFSFFWTKLVVSCPYISNEGNAEWNPTPANGQTVSGTCLSGYYGSVSRSCIYADSTGNWSSISGSCDGAIFLKK